MSKVKKKQLYSQQKTRTKRKKIKEVVSSGIVHIYATFNNTIITLSKMNGEVIAQSSAGTIGYKGAKKSTPYAAKLAMLNILETAKLFLVKEAEVKVKGIGSGRNSALKALETSNIKILAIYDVTPLPHNGCRPPKKPRV